MKNKKNLAIASLILSILSLILSLILPTSSLTTAKIYVIILILVSIVAIVLGFISKNDTKGLATAGIVVGFVAFALSILNLSGLFIIEKVNDCVDNNDGTSTCTYMGKEMKVPTSYLKDEQIKK